MRTIKCVFSVFITICHGFSVLGLPIIGPPVNGRRIYPFNKEGLRIYEGVYHPPFDTLKIGTSTDDIKLKLYR